MNLLHIKNCSYSLTTFILLLFALAGCNRSVETADKTTYPIYIMETELNPAEGSIDVKGRLEFDADYIKGTEVSIYLDSSMVLRYFGPDTLTVLTKWEKSDTRYMPASGKITIDTSVLSDKNGKSVLYFSYSGKLSELPPNYANIISADWTELGLYYPWYPFSPDIKPFTYSLDIKSDSSTKLIAMGQASATEHGRLIINNTPTNDIVLCASHDMDHYTTRNGNSEISLYSHNFNDSIINSIGNDMTRIIGACNNWFGDRSNNVLLVFSKRKSGGGYARMGGLYLGGFDPDNYFTYHEGYYRYFGHEMAHLWWNRADVTTWEDWINEGFAEFSALMIIREFYGEEAFEKRIENKYKTIPGTPGIIGFDRNADDETGSKNAQIILYNKAPLFLYELEKKIGRDNFIELCRSFLAEEECTTETLTAIIKNKHGHDTAVWFNDLLNS